MQFVYIVCVMVVIGQARPQYDEDESEELNGIDASIPIISDGDKGGVEVKLQTHNSDITMNISTLKVNCVSIPCDTFFDMKSKNTEWRLSSTFPQAQTNGFNGSASKNETFLTKKGAKKTTVNSSEKSTVDTKGGKSKNLDKTVPEEKGLGTSIRGKKFYLCLIILI